MSVEYTRSGELRWLEDKNEMGVYLQEEWRGSDGNVKWINVPLVKENEIESERTMPAPTHGSGGS